jgi:hypothetical protein
VVIILMVVGIHSCSVSSRNSALRDYNNSVSALMQQSAGKSGLSGQLFTALASASSASTTLDSIAYQAEQQLQKAEGFNVPSQVSTAQRNVLLSLQMRNDALHGIALHVPVALASATSKTGLAELATDMAKLYSSDVVYKDYAAKEIAEALNSAGIPVGGASSQQIYGGQFLTSLDWLDANGIAKLIGATVPVSSTGPLAPGTHGDELSSVAVGSTTLSPSSSNGLSASPAPTFTLSVLNSSQNISQNVGCTVTLKGSSDSGHSVIPSIAVGTTQTCSVTLKSAPSPGQYTVVATVGKVRGETNLANNTMSFAVTFS